MKILVLGSDSRNNELISYYESKGNIVVNEFISVNNIDVSEYDVIVFPVGGVASNFKIENMNIPNDFLSNCKKDVSIFSGISTKALTGLLEQGNKNCTYIMQDQTVQKENAIPTVEGIVADLVMNTDITIDNSKIMVIGFGNIGKYLTKILREMGSDVVVGIIREADFDKLNNMNFSAFYTGSIQMDRHLIDTDMIVNTAPTLVITEEHIKYFKKDVYILDVASAPYGIDMNALKGCGIPYKIYSGIPSKVAPKTAGKILTKKINSIIGG